MSPPCSGLASLLAGTQRLGAAACDGAWRRADAVCRVVPGSLAAGTVAVLCAGVTLGSFTLLAGSTVVFGISAAASLVLWPTIPVAVCALGVIGLTYPLVYMAPVVAGLSGVAAVLAPAHALLTGRVGDAAAT